MGGITEQVGIKEHNMSGLGLTQRERLTEIRAEKMPQGPFQSSEVKLLLC